MAAVEEAARQEGRHPVVLDTRLGNDAERLDTRMGYLRVGVIPQFASARREHWMPQSSSIATSRHEPAAL
jgi:hypothetical protein